MNNDDVDCSTDGCENSANSDGYFCGNCDRENIEYDMVMMNLDAKINC